MGDITVRAAEGAIYLAVPLDNRPATTPIVEICLDREAAERLAGQIQIGLAALDVGVAPKVDALPEGVIEIAGERYMRDPSGRLVPLPLVKPQHALEDQTVRKIIGHAEALSAQIDRFRGHTIDDISAFCELLAGQYSERRGGERGNVQLSTYDSLMRVQVTVQDQITFGAELDAAKQLVDGCIVKWSTKAPLAPEIRALIEHAFQVDHAGKINRAALYQLRRLDIDDADWRAAMAAVADAMRVVGSKEYVRFQRRVSTRAPWSPITVDLAKAGGVS